MICRAGQDRKDLNPFYFALLGSTCAAASARGYEVLVSFQDSAEKLLGPLRGTPQGRWHDRHRHQREHSRVGLFRRARSRHQLGLLGRAERQPSPWVRSDNEAGAALAVRHMLVRGYERIVCIGSETSPQRQFKERYDGYASAMRDAGREPVLQRVERGLRALRSRAAAAAARAGRKRRALRRRFRGERR
jgi:DNA-binding LacI/PurR family transcriptional regulator